HHEDRQAKPRDCRASTQHHRAAVHPHTKPDRRRLNPRAIFITGGAGFLGINLTRHLLARGYSVVSFDIAAFDYPEREAVSAITGDIRDAAALTDAMRGCGTVVHCAAGLPSYTADAI